MHWIKGWFLLVLSLGTGLIQLKAQNGLQILEAPVDFIPCDSACTVLHASFPKPLKTNQYSLTQEPYAPVTITGTALNLNDDKFSTAIPLGFNFCFFEQVYTQCYIADNGVLTFNPAYSGANCNNNTQQLLPYFNSTFPDNAIFFLYMDVNPTLGGSIHYATIGTAPFRKFVISYQNMKIFGATCSNATSSYQVILNESTNIIDVHVAQKVTCDNNAGNYSNYATVGVQNTGATTAFTAPGKHASVFTMNNESIRIAPSGPLNYLLQWFDAAGNLLATNVDSIAVCPPTFPYNNINAEINFYCPTATFYDTVIIDKHIPHIDSLLITFPSCNITSNGIINVQATGYLPPLTYSINGGSYSSNHIFTGLAVGNYLISIKDANGCHRDTLVYLPPQYQVLGVVDSIHKPVCPDSNGAIFLHPANGVPAYTIVWSNGATGPVLSGIPAGNYAVTVTDANGCYITETINVTFDSLPVIQSYVLTHPVCHNGAGAIQINPSGGAVPYHYVWTNGDTTQTISGLFASNYAVTITDAHGCSTAALFNLVDTLDLMTHDTVLHHTSCGLNNGSLQIIPYFGLPPFTFSWTPGGMTTPTPTGLAPGTYVCTTKDQNNCTVIDTLTINPSLALINSISKANANCDSNNGKIYLNSVQNATGWVHVHWSNGDTTNVITGLAPGTYWVKTKDSLGCVKTDTIHIMNDGKPHLSIVSYMPPLCYGDSTGSVTLSGTYGTSPYKYSLDGLNFSSFAQLTHISGGTYTIYITDANTCLNDTVVTFPQPTQINTVYSADTVSCFGDATSTIKIGTTGGYPPYVYAYNGGTFSPQTIYTNMKQGTYAFIVKDSNQCEKAFTVLVPGPDSALQITLEKQDLGCFEQNTGWVNVLLSGGWPPYQYSWSDGSTGLHHDSLNEWHTSFHLTDARGCTTDKAVDVEQLRCCKAVVPNAFSPNGDGRNDKLRPIPISEVSSVKFSIYDRWGKELFLTRNWSDAWDGKYQGVDCEMDVYFFYLEYTCPFQKEKVVMKGDLTLLR